MKKISFLGLVLAFSGSVFAVDLAVSPTNMVWSEQGFIDVAISNITAAADVRLSVYLDVDGNGTIDTADKLATVFEMKDGQGHISGADTFVNDKDVAENGFIETAISFYGQTYIHFVGNYIWQAIELNAAGHPVGTNTVAFAVAQPAGTTWITGQIQDYFHPATPLKGALVKLVYSSDTLGDSPTVFADETGAFTLQVPVGINPATDLQGVYAMVAGYMSATEDPTGNPISFFPFTNTLAVGENVLPQPLYVVPELPVFQVWGITGNVYWVENGVTNPLAGAVVEVESTSFDDEGNDTPSWNISDTNGMFTLVYPESYDEWDTIHVVCSDPLLTLRALAGGVSAGFALNGSTNGINVYCHSADSLVRGQVLDSDTAALLAGVEVDVVLGSDQVGAAYTISNGLYEVGVVGGNAYNGQCDAQSLAFQLYVDPDYPAYIEMPIGGIQTHDFPVERGRIISGVVQDLADNPLVGGSVILIHKNSGEGWEGDWENREGSANVSMSSGYYRLLAPAGEWILRTEGFGGYWVDVYYTNSYIGDMESAIPVVVSNANVSGINFTLSEGTRIQGSVVDAFGGPAGGNSLSTFLPAPALEWDFQGKGETDWGTGSFDFLVPSGSSVYLRVDGDAWQVPETWYGDVGSRDLATPVSLPPGTTVSNLNIQLIEGFQLSGMVKEQVLDAGVANATITAFDLASNQYSTAFSDSSGWCGMMLPANTPLTFYVDANGFEGEYFNNVYDIADASFLQKLPGENQNITFTLHATATDSDGDGLPDFVEDSTPDGNFGPEDYSDRLLADTDKDGAMDGDEYFAETDPRDANSVFKIIESTPGAAGLVLRWNSVPGRQYWVKISPDLSDGSWSNMATVVATAPETTYTPPITQQKSYYRVQVLAP